MGINLPSTDKLFQSIFYHTREIKRTRREDAGRTSVHLPSCSLASSDVTPTLSSYWPANPLHLSHLLDLARRTSGSITLHSSSNLRDLITVVNYFELYYKVLQRISTSSVDRHLLVIRFHKGQIYLNSKGLYLQVKSWPVLSSWTILSLIGFVVQYLKQIYCAV